MITIDGSQGEGGGQILRTSVALSIITGERVTIENIRANRAKPGLMRQHLTAIQAAATISDASLQGAHVGATRITFRPGSLKPGDHHIAIGTAGSTSLVLQTLLPPLMIADAPSTLRIEGGTHNPKAPTPEFLQETFAPQLAKIGPKLDLTLDRAGFYPAGGGQITAKITPTPRDQLAALTLLARGDITRRDAYAVVSNLPDHIAQRELQTIGAALNWPQHQLHALNWKTPGPGNALWITLGAEHISEIFSATGQRSKSAESVAQEAIDAARAYLVSDVPVAEYLADQLLLPMALGAGGSFCCTPPSLHTHTQVDIIRRFLDVRINLIELEDRRWRIDVTT